MAIGLRGEPIAEGCIFRIQVIVMNGEDHASSADLKLIPSFNDLK